MPPSESEQLAQLNENAMRDVAQGGVTEFASDPGVQVASFGGEVLKALFSVLTAKSTRTPTNVIGAKPRVMAEGNLEGPNLNYRDTQTAAAERTLSEEGQAKFAAQGNRATDLSPDGQRAARDLAAASDAVEQTADEQLRDTIVASQRGVTAEDQGFRLTEDSSGLASQSQADEVIEAASLGEGYLRSIKEGAPFNWNNLRQPDDVKALIQAVSDSLPEQQLAATRGVVTNVETTADAVQLLADDLNLKRSVLKNKPGTTFTNAAEATAARMLLADSAKQLRNLAEQVKLRQGGDAVILQFRRQLAVHNGIQLQIKGAQTEAARLLQSFNIPVTDGMAPDVSALMNMDVIEASGGAKTMMMAAEGLLDAHKKGGDSAFNEAAQKGIMSKFRNGVEHLYINGLLSGPKTQFKNLLGNALFGLMQVPEEFLAGICCTVERTAFKAVGKEIDYTKQKYISDVGHRMTAYAVSFSDAWAAAREAFVRGEAGDSIVKSDFNTYRSGNTNLSDTPFGLAMTYLHNVTGIPTRGLLAGDDFFKVLSQNGELAVLANHQKKAALASGMTARQAQDEADMVRLSPRQFAPEIDVKGRYDTLMSDTGALGKAASSFQNTWYGRYILPFATAPTNDILRTFERTPLGLLHKEMIGSDASKRQMRLGRFAFASMTVGMVANYAGQGYITGGIPMSKFGYVDKKKRAKLPPGWQPYSFVFRGENFPVDENGDPLPLFDKYHNPNGPLNYYSYAGLGPLASVIGLTAGAVQYGTLARNSTEYQYSTFGAVIHSVGYFRELPFLKGMADVLKALSTGDSNYLTAGPVGSMNLGVPIPNPASALTRTIERIGDNTVTRAGADFEFYTKQEVRELTDAKKMKRGIDGNYDWAMVGQPKGEMGLKFQELMSNWKYQAIATNPFVDDINAEIPRYDTLGNLVTDGPTYEEAPTLRLWNAFSPITVSSSEEQPKYVKELVRLDWPIPQAPKRYKGVVLSTLQQSNLVWLAKGDRDQVPPSLEGLDRSPVRVKVSGIGYVTFQTALANLMTPGNRKWRRANDKQKRALVSSLNDQFLEAAFSRLVGLPGNEKVGRAAKDIEGLKDRGML